MLIKPELQSMKLKVIKETFKKEWDITFYLNL